MQRTRVEIVRDLFEPDIRGPLSEVNHRVWLRFLWIDVQTRSISERPSKTRHSHPHRRLVGDSLFQGGGSEG